MKKLILILALIGICLTGNVFAETRDGHNSTGMSVSALVQQGDWQLYRLWWYTTAAGGKFAIYDSVNQSTASNTTVKAEGGDLNTTKSGYMDFSNYPIEGSNGLYVVITSCQVVLEWE